MIAFITGTVAAYTVDTIIVNNQGIGWEIYYPHTDKIRLNEQVNIYTYMHITENDVSLFGFESMREKELFMRLISVKGIGPRTVMPILTKADTDTIIGSIEQGNVAFLKSMPGIGNKTASQIILDLKGKLVETEQKGKPVPAAVAEAMEALKNLGYKTAEINSAANVMNEKPGLTTEEYIRMGLQFLMKKKLGG